MNKAKFGARFVPLIFAFCILVSMQSVNAKKFSFEKNSALTSNESTQNEEKKQATDSSAALDNKDTNVVSVEYPEYEVTTVQDVPVITYVTKVLKTKRTKYLIALIAVNIVAFLIALKIKRNSAGDDDDASE